MIFTLLILFESIQTLQLLIATLLLILMFVVDSILYYFVSERRRKQCVRKNEKTSFFHGVLDQEKNRYLGSVKNQGNSS